MGGSRKRRVLLTSIYADLTPLEGGSEKVQNHADVSSLLMDPYFKYGIVPYFERDHSYITSTY